MIILKIILDMVCGILNALGGWKILWMRRYLMPVIIGTGVSLTTHIWWLGLTVLPVMGTLCLGYFKITNQFFARGLWLALQAFVIGLGSLILGHLSWYFYIPYMIIAGALAGFLYNIEQIDGDLIFGCWLSSVIFLIH